MINETFTISSLYIVVILLTMFALNVLSRGFLFTFLAVKISMGKKVMVLVHNRREIYYRAGVVREGFLQYKDNTKQRKTIDTSSALFSRTMNVSALQVDEEHNAVINPDFEAVQPFDASRYDDYLSRAVESPIETIKFERIVLLLLIVIVGAVAFTAYKVIGIEALIKAAQTITGGNIP